MTDVQARLWLTRAAWVVIGFGLLTAAAAFPPFAEPTRLFADLALWPLDGAQSLAAPEARLLCGILGGVLVGWGAAQLIVIRELMPERPALAARVLRHGALAWFATDSVASIVAGAAANVVGNIVFLAMFLIPLALREGRRAPGAA